MCFNCSYNITLVCIVMLDRRTSNFKLCNSYWMFTITYNGSTLAIAINSSVFADVLVSKSNFYKLNE